MIRVEVIRREGSIVSVECKGHSGYAEEGADIVCAAVSSIVQTAVLGLLQVVGVDVCYSTDAETGYLALKLDGHLDKTVRHDCDTVLETMLLGVADLYQGFSDFVELEVK